jgi:hypothetical protein
MNWTGDTMTNQTHSSLTSPIEDARPPVPTDRGSVTRSRAPFLSILFGLGSPVVLPMVLFSMDANVSETSVFMILAGCGALAFMFGLFGILRCRGVADRIASVLGIAVGVVLIIALILSLSE